MRLAALFLSGLISSASAASSHTITLHAWPTSAPSPTPFATVVYSTAETSADGVAQPQYKTEIKSFEAPVAAAEGDASEPSLLRIGHFDGAKQFSSSLTSSAIFSPGQRHRIVLHVDEKGDVWRTELHGVSGAVPQSPKKQRKSSRPKSEKRLAREAAEAAAEARRQERRELAKLRREGKLKPGEKLPPKKEVDLSPVVVEVRGPTRGAAPVLNTPVVLNAEGKVEGAPQTDDRTFLQKYWWLFLVFMAIQLIGAGGAKE